MLAIGCRTFCVVSERVWRQTWIMIARPVSLICQKGLVAMLLCSLTGHAAERWWSDPVELTLSGSGTNRVELQGAVDKVREDRREGMAFLLEHMPEIDRGRLPGSLLLTHVDLAYEAMATAPWGRQVPKEIFLNDVLPYACVNEPRDDWRPRLREISLPLIEGSQTPGEAARRLNEQLFPLLKVKYSTQRKRPDQSPLETMESGMATCTGLSILLADACRAVGIPARIVGTPLWANMRGNHTWVEIWDGDWHFVGAAEPDPQGLDRGWFVHDASQAKRDEPRHAIYASSFRPTGTSFPMVWARRIDWVPAENVTDRYTPKAEPVAEGKSRLLVKVLDRLAGQRVPAAVEVLDLADSTKSWTGISRGERVDLNDILPFEVETGRTYIVTARLNGLESQIRVEVGEGAEQVVVVPLSRQRFLGLPSQACYQVLPVTPAGR